VAHAEIAYSKFERAARAAAIAAIALAVAVLAGWIFDVSRLRGPIPGLIEMKANTAIAFVFGAASLLLLARRDLDRRLRVVAHLCAGGAFVIGALSLSEYVLGRNVGIDQLLFHDPSEGPSDPTVSPGRLAPQTSVGFMLAGAALTTLDADGRRRLVGEVLALAGAGVAFFALLGYVYSSGEFQAVAALQPIAVHTAAGLLVLCLGIVLARPEHGALASLRGDELGTVVARRLLPVVFVVLPLVGWLRVKGHQAGLYDDEAGSALLIAVFLAILTAGTVASARKLNRVDQARHESDQAVRESQRLLQAIIDNTTSVVYVKDADGRFVLVNRRFEELTNRSRAEIQGRTEYDLFPRETADAVRSSDLEVIRTNAPLELEMTASGDSGPRTFISNKFPLRDAAGRAVGVCGVSTDITERKQAGEAVERARDEAERASRVKSEFLSRMSHELRTPLAAVIGFGQLLEMSKLDQRQRDSVGQILNGGSHLLDLINELLDISRIESDSMAISIEPVRVASVVEEALTLVEPLATERSVALRADHEPVAGAHVMADQQRLKQVLINLLSNAVKYNREGGLVTIRLITCPHGRLRLLVSDTGPGIEEAKLEKLFEPFERLGAEATGIEGTGLGLTLSRGLVELMGGSISVESEVGRGTTFAVELRRAAEPEGVLEQAADNAPSGVLPGLGPCTILYIEDNDANFRLIERFLEERPGISLLSAKEGRAGLRVAVEQRPDLVLLDLHLPDVHGTEVLARLRRNPLTRSTPVIVVTADATRSRSKLLLEAGAQAYLTKPLDLERLIVTISEVLAAAPAGGQQTEAA
jgi:PAS domain S-box-containing protein